MVERQRLGANQLTAELQRQLNFDVDPSGEWLMNDNFLTVGGATGYESLPTIARVSSDGTRYEIGVRRVDLEGVLELAKIIRSTVQTVDTISNFWKNHPKFSTKVEEDMVYISANIEPTLKGFEAGASSVNFAYDIAIESAILGRTYEKLGQDGWYGGIIKQIENPGNGGSVFSKNKSQQPTGEEPEKDSTREMIPPITADTLREYPLGSVWYGLPNAPGTVKVERREKRDFVHGWVVLQPENVSGLGDSGRVVEIRIPETYKEEVLSDEEIPRDDLTVYLQVPGGLTVQTVDDIRNLKTAEVFVKADNTDGYIFRRIGITVTMENDSFEIRSADEGFYLKLRKPCCPECQTPTWKWPIKKDMIKNFDVDPKDWGDNPHLYEHVAGGVEPPKFYPIFEKANDERLPYCGNCINTVVNRYKEQHPYASRSKAIKLTRKKLDGMGYQGVDIIESQVWNSNGGWDVLTQLEYQRGGRTITRDTGSPHVSHDGEFKPNMLPHEYMAFRYKTE